MKVKAILAITLEWFLNNKYIIIHPVQKLIITVSTKESETHLKSRTGCQKPCEIFESLKIFHSLYNIPYINGYKSVNLTSRVRSIARHYLCRTYSALRHETINIVKQSIMQNLL